MHSSLRVFLRMSVFVDLLKMGILPDSHIPPTDHDHLKLKVISLSDDSDLERVYGISLEEGTSSSISLDSILSNVGGEVNINEVCILHSILIEEKIQANLQRGDHAKMYIQLCPMTNKYEPNDVDVRVNFDLQDRLDVAEHG